LMVPMALTHGVGIERPDSRLGRRVGVHRPLSRNGHRSRAPGHHGSTAVSGKR
jgi:hypothetical protein